MKLSTTVPAPVPSTGVGRKVLQAIAENPACYTLDTFDVFASVVNTLAPTGTAENNLTAVSQQVGLISAAAHTIGGVVGLVKGLDFLQRSGDYPGRGLDYQSRCAFSKALGHGLCAAGHLGALMGIGPSSLVLTGLGQVLTHVPPARPST